MAAVVMQGAVEGDLDAALLSRIGSEQGAEFSTIYGRRGKARLHRQIGGFNRAARLGPWVVLVDLDLDAPCASALVADWLPDRAPAMALRVAVHEAEAWLMADRERMASFLAISVDVIPRDPDSLDDPKQTLVNLARRSGDRGVREGLVPSEGSRRSVGVAYNALLIDYIRHHWRPNVAADTSESLRRCLAAIERLREAAAEGIGGSG